MTTYFPDLNCLSSFVDFEWMCNDLYLPVSVPFLCMLYACLCNTRSQNIAHYVMPMKITKH